MQIPKSLRAYFTERAVQTAVDALLANPDIGIETAEWDELPRYYGAVLAASQTKVDYATFLLTFVQAVWSPALNRAGLQNNRVHFSEDEYTDVSIDGAWNEEFVQIPYVTPLGKLYCGASIEDRHLRAWFHLWDARDEYIQVAPGGRWLRGQEEGWEDDWLTPYHSTDWSSDTLDLSPWIKDCDDAIGAVFASG